MNKIFFILGGVLVVLLVAVSVFKITHDQKNAQRQAVDTKEIQQEEQNTETFFYTGQSGKDALILLEEKAVVEKAPSGFVTKINNRKADEAKKEFWAFYVNGEMATVGPSEYQTKETDRIEWKIDHY